MEDRAPANSVSATPQSSGIQHEGRNVWVLTAYGISGLALVGILAYFFSDFVAH